MPDEIKPCPFCGGSTRSLSAPPAADDIDGAICTDLYIEIQSLAIAVDSKRIVGVYPDGTAKFDWDSMREYVVRNDIGDVAAIWLQALLAAHGETVPLKGEKPPFGSMPKMEGSDARDHATPKPTNCGRQSKPAMLKLLSDCPRKERI